MTCIWGISFQEPISQNVLSFLRKWSEQKSFLLLFSKTFSCFIFQKTWYFLKKCIEKQNLSSFYFSVLTTSVLVLWEMPALREQSELEEECRFSIWIWISCLKNLKCIKWESSWETSKEWIRSDCDSFLA